MPWNPNWLFKFIAGVFGKAGEIQTNLCLAFGPNDVTYSGTLSGEIYKWKGHNLSGTIPNAHTVSWFLHNYGGAKLRQQRKYLTVMVTDWNMYSWIDETLLTKYVS